MDIVFALIAFAALVASWFVLPSTTPVATTAHANTESLASAA